MDLEQLAYRIGERLLARGWLFSVAESCTGGWVAKIVTDIAGSSQWFDRGFVTYSNEAKQEMLSVSAATLLQYGAVSEATVCEMVEGVLNHSRAQVALAITGIAGPGGGSEDKPVGTVWIAWQVRGKAPVARVHRFPGDRAAVRSQSVDQALLGLLDVIEQHG